jgi:hypothetical protein
MGTSTLRFPVGPIADKSGYATIEWRQWLQNPTFVSFNIAYTSVLQVAGGGTGVTTSTGTGSFVLNNSPTFISPYLGTPASGNLANCTNLPYSSLSGAVPTWNQSTSGNAATATLATSATTATNIAGGLGGYIPYQSAVNTTALLANGTSGQVLKSNGTTVAPSWVTLGTMSLQNANAITESGTVADTSYSYQTPLTGFTITIADGIQTLILEPAGTLLAGTITMPSTPVDGQLIRITSTQSITTLTLSPNAGQSVKNAPTGFTVNLTGSQGYELIYRLANTTWYRLQ